MGLPVYARVYCAMWSAPKPRWEIPQGFGLTARQIINRLLCSVLSLFHKTNQVVLNKTELFFSTGKLTSVVFLVHTPTQTKHTEDPFGHFYRMQISPFSERARRRPKVVRRSCVSVRPKN